MNRPAIYDEPCVFELGPSEHVITKSELIDADLQRDRLDLPELEESEVMRHFIRLSQMTFCVDTGLYPLGSCTMKYTPKVLQHVASLPGFLRIHPEQPARTVQGALHILYCLERLLAEIGGMDEVSLQPAAGAHGEFTGMLIARAYHQSRGERRDQVIVPDTAHGTNPASASMAGFDVVEIPSDDHGTVDLQALDAALSERTAAFMLTNPNTLGIFESRVCEISDLVHDQGALMYYDGANLNAILGITKPGTMGFDIVHFNLHKTFGAPHGGGGPGSGPVGVKKELAGFLPVPRIVREGGLYRLDYDRPESIGKVHSFFGNFSVCLKAYAYLLMHGKRLKEVSRRAVLNANYLSSILSDVLDLPFPGLRKHEFVLSGSRLRSKGLRTIDLAKRLIDFGFHPPTIYFPDLVSEAIMVEPTETESRSSLDAFASAVRQILKEDAGMIKKAPLTRPRVDEVTAFKDLKLTWDMARECVR